MPAWLPVKQRASTPRLLIAIASSAIEMRSPAVSSMSSSRGSGTATTWCARSMSSSVVSPIAETATTTSLPALRVSAMRFATRLIALGVGDARAAELLDDEDTGKHSTGMGTKVILSSERMPRVRTRYAARPSISTRPALERAAEGDLVGVLRGRRPPAGPDARRVTRRPGCISRRVR